MNVFQILLKKRYQARAYNDYHDSLQIILSVNDVAVTTVGENDYIIHFQNMSKTEDMRGMKIADLSVKSRIEQA